MFSFKSYDYVELTNTVLALRSTLLRFISFQIIIIIEITFTFMNDVDLLSTLMIFIYTGSS